MVLWNTLGPGLVEGDYAELLIINEIQPSLNPCTFSPLCEAVAALSIIRLSTFLIRRLGYWNPTIRNLTISFITHSSDIALYALKIKLLDITRQLQCFRDSRYLYIREKRNDSRVLRLVEWMICLRSKALGPAWYFSSVPGIKLF